MKIAVITDIHGNAEALDAVLADIEAAGVERRFCAGDLLGLGPRPNRVLNRIREEGIPTILGNHEVEVLAELRGKGSGKDHIVWTAGVLKRRHVRWLKRLPFHLVETLDGCGLLLVHGTPRSVYDYVFPSLTTASLDAWFPDDDRPDILVAGHTHIPFARRLGGMLVVNAGTAGKPIDGDPRASWALIEIVDGKARGSIRRTAYPVEKTLAAMKKVRLRKGLVRALRHSMRRWPPRRDGSRS